MVTLTVLKTLQEDFHLWFAFTVMVKREDALLRRKSFHATATKCIHCWLGSGLAGCWDYPATTKNSIWLMHCYASELRIGSSSNVVPYESWSLGLLPWFHLYAQYGWNRNRMTAMGWMLTTHEVSGYIRDFRPIFHFCKNSSVKNRFWIFTESGVFNSTEPPIIFLKQKSYVVSQGAYNI